MSGSLAIQDNISLHNTSISPNTLIRPQISGGKVTLPANNFTIYAQFKHVTAVPAASNNGYSVSRLRILDRLIDRLVQMKKSTESQREKAALLSNKEQITNLNQETLDQMIKIYSKQLQQELRKADSSINSQLGLKIAGDRNNSLLFSLEA